MGIGIQLSVIGYQISANRYQDASGNERLAIYGWEMTHARWGEGRRQFAVGRKEPIGRSAFPGKGRSRATGTKKLKIDAEVAELVQRKRRRVAPTVLVLCCEVSQGSRPGLTSVAPPALGL